MIIYLTIVNNTKGNGNDTAQKNPYKDQGNWEYRKLLQCLEINYIRVLKSNIYKLGKKKNNESNLPQNGSNLICLQRKSPDFQGILVLLLKGYITIIIIIAFSCSYRIWNDGAVLKGFPSDWSSLVRQYSFILGHHIFSFA